MPPAGSRASSIIGFDAIPDALDNIRSGRLLGSVAQFPSEMGRLGVKHAVELVRDGTPPPEEVLTKVEIIDLREPRGIRSRGGSAAEARRHRDRARLCSGCRGSASASPGCRLSRMPISRSLPGEVHVLLGENGAGKIDPDEDPVRSVRGR